MKKYQNHVLLPQHWRLSDDDMLAIAVKMIGESNVTGISKDDIGNSVLHIQAEFKVDLERFHNTVFSAIFGANQAIQMKDSIFAERPLPNHEGFVRHSRYVDYQTTSLAEFFCFAQWAKMMPEDFEQGLEVLVTVEYFLRNMENFAANMPTFVSDEKALAAARAAVAADYHYMIVDYVGEEEPDPDELRHYELFGVNS
jgi:hypothetical protein